METGCHVWRAPSAARHYVRFHLDGKRVLGHRLIWEVERGPIPEGLVIDHLCRNRACVNVEHMEVVTQAVNKARGTSPVAENGRKQVCPRCGGEYRRDGDGRRCFRCRRETRPDVKRHGIGLPGERTHCPKGHEYTEDNTYLVKKPDGSIKQRACKECGRERVRARRALGRR